MKRFIYILLFLYSLFFVTLSLASPILAKLGAYKLSAESFFLFSGSCHQQPHLSFWLLGYPMPLCCRCFGVYLGSSIFSILFALDKVKLNLAIYFFLLLITLTDLSLNYLFNINTGKFIRFSNGLIMSFLIISSIDYILFKCRRRVENV